MGERVWVITGVLLAVIAQSALAQKSPITFTIEYQNTDELTSDQLVLLKGVVGAAYKTLRTFVLPKTPTGPLLAQRVCRSYVKIPSPPPRPPLSPLPPDYPAAPEPEAGPGARRLLAGGSLASGSGGEAHSAAGDDATADHPDLGYAGCGDVGHAAGGHLEPRLVVPEAVAGTAAERRSLQGGGSGGGGGGGGAVSRCYPDFEAADGRLRSCGLAAIARRHVRNATAGAALSLTGEPGEQTDLYLYVTASSSGPSACAPGYDISTTTCLYDPDTGRPTMAAVNVCPEALDRYDVDSLVARTLRALLRALGVERVGFFGLAARSLYGGYLLEAADPLTGEARRFLATPNVQQAVRDHFGCDTAAGALLEDAFLGSGAAHPADGSVVLGAGEALDDPDYAERAALVFSGWETTHFQGDILVGSPDPTPASGSAPQVTALTLALLLDTGWYGVLPSAAGYWGWGRGRGCLLASRPCAALLREPAWAAAEAAAGEAPLLCDPASSTSQRSLCAPGGLSTGSCASDPVFTGPACGLVTPPTPGLPTCATREGEIAALSAGDAAAAAAFGWAAGATSRCSPLLWPWTARPNATQPAISFPSGSPAAASGASCFRASCDANGSLFFDILGTQVRCPTGAVVNLTAALLSGSSAAASSRRLTGVLGPCPDNAATCGSRGCDPASCSATGGECRPAAASGSSSSSSGGSRCYCRPGYGGAGCEVSWVSGAAEKLEALAAAYQVVEASLVLQLRQSRFFARSSQLLGVLGDTALALGVFNASLTSQLAVARMRPMAAFPAYTRAGGDPRDLQVVVRFLAADAAQAAAFSFLLAAGSPARAALLAALGGYGLLPVAEQAALLGAAYTRTQPPPSPPQPPQPPSPPPHPLPPAPPSPPSVSSRGLDYNERVAVGVGVTFGCLALLLAALLVRHFRRFKQNEYKHFEKQQSKEAEAAAAARSRASAPGAAAGGPPRTSPGRPPAPSPRPEGTPERTSGGRAIQLAAASGAAAAAAAAAAGYAGAATAPAPDPEAPSQSPLRQSGSAGGPVSHRIDRPSPSPSEEEAEGSRRGSRGSAQAEAGSAEPRVGGPARGPAAADVVRPESVALEITPVDGAAYVASPVRPSQE